MSTLPNVRPHTESAELGGDQMQTLCGFTGVSVKNVSSCKKEKELKYQRD